jgi:hypothetical protein
MSDIVPFQPTNGWFAYGILQRIGASRFLNKRSLTGSSKVTMQLAQRNPSVNWEPVPLDPSGQFSFWVWFRPVSMPTGLMLLVPATLFANAELIARLSVRQLVAAVGLDPVQIICWTIGGMNFGGLGGTSPLLDQILPAPQNGGNLDVSIWMSPVMVPVMSPVATGYPTLPIGQPAPGSFGVSNEDSQLLDALDDCWNGVMNLEVRINSIRKELASGIARLNSVNRDLSSDERRFCDSSDLQDWSEARRWLRDSVLVLTKSMKEIDMGTTSGAGRRTEFNDIYRNHVVPRIPFPGLMQVVHEYDTYRKVLQNLVASAQANISRAGRDAENRANSVLQRIASKVRTRRRKT